MINNITVHTYTPLYSNYIFTVELVYIDTIGINPYIMYSNLHIINSEPNKTNFKFYTYIHI